MIRSTPCGGGFGRGQVENRVALLRLPAGADRDTLLVVGHVEPLDRDLDAEHKGEMAPWPRCDRANAVSVPVTSQRHQDLSTAAARCSLG
jgi:hypothetical protein